MVGRLATATPPRQQEKRAHPEVTELDNALPRKEDIGRLQVAVKNAPIVEGGCTRCYLIRAALDILDVGTANAQLVREYWCDGEMCGLI